ncbi:helix-turn-helix domain-containing protein [Polaribacter batillariae]|uniref:Helix-turn-helix domain-containing protein n=1 Tax=Polaribacter batillariae TaxID=2808900 RepID=A0ABX7T0V7_9FLAO|nr:AraC family transcriptional regulator [Polaribacter batillariae]QTD38896.1 helix-turn-helix domain-containing protein [Polaribacter batillariae]
MKRFTILKSIDVIEFEAKQTWGYPKHKHNFYELTFILKGKGKHVFNDSAVAYKKGDVFFLTPKDEHEFLVKAPSKFGILKFTEQLFLEKTNFSIINKELKAQLESIIFNSSISDKSIKAYQEDKKQLLYLYKMIKTELESPNLRSRNIILELFGALLLIVSRNLISNVDYVSNPILLEKEKIENILRYIRLHLFDADKVKIKALANTFNMSANYISIYVKKQTGISIKDYIIKSKLKLAERLLEESNLNITQIATKTGFVDVSHFSKIFKNKYGKSPSEYHKK